MFITRTTEEADLTQAAIPKMDNRVQRTRKRIQESFMALTVEQGYDAINVQDIVDHAKINRSTFYRHYLDKDDLLSKYMQEVTDSTFKDDFDSDNTGVVKLLNHIQLYSEFYRIMLSANGHPLVSERLRQKVENRFRAHLTPHNKTQGAKGASIELQLRSMSAAGIGAILWWVENNTPCTSEELAVWIGQLSSAAVEQSMKFPSLPGKPT